MPETHTLKTISRYFHAVARGEKTFEVRRNDRAFQTGDILKLVEVDDSGRYVDPFTCDQNALVFRITYLLQGGQFGIEPGFCVLGLGRVEDTPDA